MNFTDNQLETIYDFAENGCDGKACMLCPLAERQEDVQGMAVRCILLSTETFDNTDGNTLTKLAQKKCKHIVKLFKIQEMLQ